MVHPWRHVRFLKQFGSDMFRHFDVCWTQTNKQTNMPNIGEDIYRKFHFLLPPFLFYLPITNNFDIIQHKS